MGIFKIPYYIPLRLVRQTINFLNKKHNPKQRTLNFR